MSQVRKKCHVLFEWPLILKSSFLITGRFSFNHFEVIRISFNHSLILKYILISFYCGISFFFLEFVFKRKEKMFDSFPILGKRRCQNFFFNFFSENFLNFKFFNQSTGTKKKRFSEKIKIYF